MMEMAHISYHQSYHQDHPSIKYTKSIKSLVSSYTILTRDIAGKKRSAI